MRTALDRSCPDLRRAYLALVVMGGIGAHLASEFAAMGAAAGRITLSPLHYYLGAALFAAVAVLAHDLRALSSNATSGRDAKRLAEIALTSLPFGGRRGFLTMTASLQFAVAWTTVVAEGSPLFGHDVGAGAVAALLGALLLSLVIRAISRRLPTFACAVVEFEPVPDETPHVRALLDEPGLDAFLHDIWCSRLYDRPPPRLQLA